MSIFRFLERIIDAPTVPEEHAAMIRGEQIEAFKHVLPYGVLATAINSAIIIGCAYFATPTRALVWAAIMVAALAVGFPAAIHAYRSKKTPRPRPASHLSPPVQSAMMFGLVWSVAPILLIPGAPAPQQMLVTTVIAGMMCGGAYIFSTVPRAAVAFVGTIGLGFVGAMLTSNFGFGKWPLIGLLIIYSFIMAKAAYWNYANYIRAWTQQIELNSQKAALGAQNEVINLLLKDFEQTASDILWETDQDGHFVRMTDELAERLNVDPARTKDNDIASILTRGGGLEADVRTVINKMTDVEFFRDVTLRLTTEAGDRWLSFSGKTKEDGGYRGVVADITDAHQAEDKIRYLAHYDGLTGLANREQLKVEMQAALDDAEASGNGFALLCLDLDRFKVINDTHGHLIGDHVLKVSAERMLACIGENDVAARAGGDEFIILQRDGITREHVSILAEKLIKTLEEPIKINSLIVQVSTSIGVSGCPENGLSANGLLKNADLALYRAKQSGRAQFCFYEQDMDDEVSDRRQLEADLREAVREGQFRLFFQPLIDSNTRKAIGFETLLRWDHPTLGLVTPDSFINVAEQTGMISAIGEWVIREALREASCWVDGQSVSINLSPIQVKSPGLMPTIIQALAQSGIAPERVEFEITESVLLDESESSMAKLHELHQMGIKISLDDFGTGYSSLSYLSSFPFDKIKIDKSFVQSIDDSPECRAIVRAVAGLAGSLGIRSTAEGLETEQQIAGVMEEGCSELQGYYFCRPKPAPILAADGVLRRDPTNRPMPTDTPVGQIETEDETDTPHETDTAPTPKQPAAKKISS